MLFGSLVGRVATAAGLIILGAVAAAYLSLVSDNATFLGKLVPDSVAYVSHVALGDALLAAGRWPDKAATQWIRAASHAQSQSELEKASHGLASARRVSKFDWHLDDRLCTFFLDASPNARTAITDAGASCSLDPLSFGHVEPGTPIVYQSRPPIGGPHYPRWYPSYGVAPDIVAPGYWVHNLEHGAVVLLYRCTDNCPAVAAQLEDVYAALPPVGHNERLSGGPRLLITEYADMDHAFAIVAWGHKFETDQIDASQFTDFYVRFIDRGPECRNLVCPI